MGQNRSPNRQHSRRRGARDVMGPLQLEIREDGPKNETNLEGVQREGHCLPATGLYRYQDKKKRE